VPSLRVSLHSNSEEQSGKLSCFCRSFFLGQFLDYSFQILTDLSGMRTIFFPISSDHMFRLPKCNFAFFLPIHAPRGRDDLVRYPPRIRFNISEEALRGILPFPVSGCRYYQFSVWHRPEGWYFSYSVCTEGADFGGEIHAIISEDLITLKDTGSPLCYTRYILYSFFRYCYWFHW